MAIITLVSCTKKDIESSACSIPQAGIFVAGEINGICRQFESGIDAYIASPQPLGSTTDNILNYRDTCFELHGCYFIKDSGNTSGPMIMLSITVPTSGMLCMDKSADDIQTGDYRYSESFFPMNLNETIIQYSDSTGFYASNYGKQDDNAYFKITRVEDTDSWDKAIGNPHYFKKVTGICSCKLFDTEKKLAPVTFKDIAFCIYIFY